MSDQRRFLRPFASVFGAPIHSSTLPDEHHRLLAGHLPAPILELLREDGIASYRDSALRTLDPIDWQDIVPIWTDKFPGAFPFVMTAFGDFYFWADRAIWICFIQHARIMFCMESPDSFLNDFLTDPAYLSDLEVFERNSRGLESAGERGPSEIYLWTPAFALGGNPETSSIDKGDARVAMRILAALQPIVVDDV